MTPNDVLPSAKGMSRYVEVAVARWTRSPRRLPLDFSPPSLRVADRVVAGLCAAGAHPADVAGPLRTLGAYLGEVMVRSGGGRWVDLDGMQREHFGQPVGVLMPDGRVWNPIGRVLRLYAGEHPRLGRRGGAQGLEASLYTFYLMLHGRRR